MIVITLNFRFFIPRFIDTLMSSISSFSTLSIATTTFKYLVIFIFIVEFVNITHSSSMVLWPTQSRCCLFHLWCFSLPKSLKDAYGLRSCVDSSSFLHFIFSSWSCTEPSNYSTIIGSKFFNSLISHTT